MREVLRLALEAVGKVCVLTNPQVVAGVEEVVTDGVADHPPPPLRHKPVGHDDVVPDPHHGS